MALARNTRGSGPLRTVEGTTDDCDGMPSYVDRCGTELSKSTVDDVDRCSGARRDCRLVRCEGRATYKYPVAAHSRIDSGITTIEFTVNN
jgi:hypothetical protein